MTKCPSAFQICLKTVSGHSFLWSLVSSVCLVLEATVHQEGVHTVWQDGVENEPSVFVGHLPFPHFEESKTKTEIFSLYHFFSS